MFTRASAAALLAVAPAVFAAPAPQVTSFGPDSQVPYQPQSTAGPDYPVVVEQNGYTSAPYHGPYNGTATTTGAANGPSTIAASIPTQPPNPTATYYNANGIPQKPFPAPYTPAGGLGTNGSLPRYMVESDFDFESIALGLYQEWIELDLFHDGLARFSLEELEAAGLNAEYQSLINFMANQESGHATLLTNMLGEAAPKQCEYLPLPPSELTPPPANLTSSIHEHVMLMISRRLRLSLHHCSGMARFHATSYTIWRVRRVGLHQPSGF